MGALGGLLPVIAFLACCVLGPVFAWRNALSDRVRTIVALAVVGLILTGLGAAMAVDVLLPRPAPSHGLNLLAGLFLLIWIALSVLVELTGVILALCACLIGLRRTAQGRTAWFVALLVGAVAPLVAALIATPLMGALALTHTEQIVLAGPSIQGAPVLLVGIVVAPVMAAVVTTTYAISTARTGTRERSTATPRAA